jgi:hypothetical protein
MSDNYSEKPIIDDTIPAPGPYRNPKVDPMSIQTDSSDLPEPGEGTQTEVPMPDQGSDSTS